MELHHAGRTIRPRTAGQARYVTAIRDHDLTFCIGPAGTGKTYLAVAMAVQALKQEHIRKIVLVRPAVEAGESLGFLPGDLQAKINPYLRPLLDALREMMDYDLIKRYTEQDLIEMIPLAYMRGRTLNDAFVILDEAQNTTVAQMKMFLTRMGLGTKMVVSGDTTQVDLPAHARSGLIDAVHRLQGHHRLLHGDARQLRTSCGTAWCRRLSAPTRTSRRNGARTMATGMQKRTRSERVAALELPPGLVERTLECLQRGDVLGRLGLCLLTALLLWCVTGGWAPPLGYRTGFTPLRDISARVEFSRKDPQATQAAQDKARRSVHYIYEQDKEPLVQLKAALLNRVVQVMGAKSLDQLDGACLAGVLRSAASRRRHLNAPRVGRTFSTVPRSPAQPGGHRKTGPSP